MGSNIKIKEADGFWQELESGTKIKEADGFWETLKTGDMIKEADGFWETLVFDGGGILTLSASPSGLSFPAEDVNWLTVNINISGNTLGWSINTVSDAWIHTTIIGDSIKVLADVNVAHLSPLRNGTILIEADDDTTIQSIINVHQAESPY